MNIAASIKKVFDYIVWVAFFGFLLLGVIIYVTNNTYPGDKMYPFKLKFEEFALLTSKVLNKQIDFSIDLVSKRSYEVAKILSSKNSAETLNRLDTQVELTAASISQISDPVEKKKAAEQYIIKLNEASTILSEKQKEFDTTSTTTSGNQSQPIEQPSPYPTTQQKAQSTSTLIPTPTTQSTLTEPTIAQQPTVQPTAIPTIQPTTIIFPTPTTAPALTNEIVSQQINNSQQTIQQAIIIMNDISTTDNRDFKKVHKPELKKELKPELKQEMSNKSDEKQKEIKDVIKIKNKSESN